MDNSQKLATLDTQDEDKKKNKNIKQKQKTQHRKLKR